MSREINWKIIKNKHTASIQCVDIVIDVTDYGLCFLTCKEVGIHNNYLNTTNLKRAKMWALVEVKELLLDKIKNFEVVLQFINEVTDDRD